MPRLRLLLAAGFFLLLTTSRAAYCWGDVPDLSPGPLKVPQETLRAWAQEEQPDDPEAGIQTLLSRSEVLVRADGTRRIRTWTISRMLTQDAVREALRMETAWSPWDAERPEVRVRIIQPDGKEILLDDSRAIEQGDGGGSRDTVDDTRQLVLLLAGLRVDSIVETIESFNYRPAFGGAFVDTMSMVGFSPAAVAQLHVRADPGASFHWDVLEWDLQPQIQHRAEGAEGYSEVMFELKPAKGLFDYWQTESGPDHAPAPMVRIAVPSRWDRVAQEYWHQIEPQILEGQQYAALLTANIDPEAPLEDQVNECLQRLRQAVVYNGIEFGINRIVPYSAEEILTRGFGDCKDQSMLLVAMLRTLGIEADAVLIKTGSGLDVSPHLPALNQFDHMIVRVGGDEPLWMDPTAVGFPCGVLPPLCMGRRCLIINGSTTELSTTPAMTPADDVFVASTVYDLDSAGFGIETITIRYDRIGSIRIRASLSGEPGSEEFAASMRELNGAPPDVVTASQYSEEDGALDVVMKYQPAQLGDSTSQRTVVTYDLRSTLTSLPAAVLSPQAIADLSGAQDRVDADYEAAHPRTMPVHLTQAYRETREVVFAYPDFLRISPPPQPFRRQLGPVSVELVVEHEDAPEPGTATVRVRCIVVVDPAAGAIDVDQVAGIRTQLEELSGPTSPLVGSFVMADLEAGQWRHEPAAVVALADRHKHYPDDAYVMARLAAFLAQLGLVGPAHHMAHAAVERTPKSPLVLQAAGEVFLVGEDGGVMSSGWESEAARSAAIAHQTLYPNTAVNVSLGRSLFGDELGLLEDDPAVLQQAVDMLEPVVRSAAIDVENRLVAATRVAIVHLLLRRDQAMSELLDQVSVGNSPMLQSLELLAALATDDSEAVDQMLAPLENASEEERLSRFQLAYVWSVLVGRWELAAEVLAAIEDRDLGVHPLGYDALQLDAAPRDLDPEDPISVARTGIGRFLCGEAESLYLTPELAAKQARSQLGDPSTMRLLGAALNNWKADAVHGAMQRLRITEDQEELGGRRLTFAALFSGVESSVYVVPTDEGRYRWFFADDAAALALWAHQRMNADQGEHARQAIVRLVALYGPLPWFNQFSGSPAARAWTRLAEQGTEGLATATAMFVMETMPHSDLAADSARLVEAASNQPAFETVHVLLQRKLLDYYHLTGDTDRELELAGKLFERYPNQFEVTSHFISLAARLGRWDVVESAAQRAAPEQNDPGRESFEVVSGIYATSPEEALKTYDSAIENPLYDKSILANTGTWHALQQGVDVRWLREWETRLADAGALETIADAHTLACVQAIIGDPQEALVTMRLSQAHRVNSEEAKLVLLGAVCQSLGLTDLAHEYYTTTIEEFPRSDSAAIARRWIDHSPSESP